MLTTNSVYSVHIIKDKETLTQLQLAYLLYQDGMYQDGMYQDV